MNKKKIIGYSLFFVVLIALYLVFVFAGTDNWKSKSPVLNTVKPFSFINEQGETFTNSNINGKVTVVNYFFTTCRGICPRQNNNLKQVYKEFKNNPEFMIVSLTSDPETDTPAQLKRYADSMQVDTRKWVFLTGRKDSLYQAARNSFMLDDPKNSVVNINDQFLHTQFWALIDKSGHIRGQIYDGLKKEDIKELRNDIKDLLAERQTGSSFSNNMFTNNP